MVHSLLQVERKRKWESRSMCFKTCDKACSYRHVLIRNGKTKTKLMYVKGAVFYSCLNDYTAIKLTKWSINSILPIIMINVIAFCNCWLLQCRYNLYFELKLCIFDRSYAVVYFATLQALIQLELNG